MSHARFGNQRHISPSKLRYINLWTKNYHIKVAYKSSFLDWFWKVHKIQTFRPQENISFLFSHFLGIHLKRGPSPLANNFSMSVQTSFVPKSPLFILLMLHRCLKHSGKYVQPDITLINWMTCCHSKIVFLISFSKQTEIISLNNYNFLLFIVERACAPCEAGTELCST